VAYLTENHIVGVTRPLPGSTSLPLQISGFVDDDVFSHNGLYGVENPRYARHWCDAVTCCGAHCLSFAVPHPSVVYPPAILATSPWWMALFSPGKTRLCDDISRPWRPFWHRWVVTSILLSSGQSSRDISVSRQHIP